MVSKSAIIPRLVIIEGKDKGKVITLTDGTAVIGRSKGDVLIHDARISRSHIAIHFDSRTGKLSFTDLKSLNGTVVNGDTTEAGELHDGDKLQIGNTLFDCQITLAGEEATSTSEILARTRERAKQAPAKAKSASSTPAASPDERRELPALQQAPDSQTREPSAMSSTQPEPKRSLLTGSISSGRALFLKIPPRVRIVGLSLLVIAVGLKALSGPSGKAPGMSGGSGSTMTSEIAAIKALEDSGKYDEALAKVEVLKQKHPNHSEPFMAEGSIYSAQNKNPLALEALQRAHGLQPEQPLVHIKLIRVMLRSAMPREAGEELQHIEKVIADRKFSKELFVEAAYLFLEFKELKQPPEKTLILAKALQKEYAPDSSIGYKLEAQLHFQENRPQDALSTMEKGRVIDPQDEWLIENSVFAKLALKDYAGAESLLDDWLKLRPTATKALLVLGYLRYNEKAYAKALPYVQRILQIGTTNPQDPYYPEGLNLMGQIYVEMQQPAEAAKFFQQGCAAGFQQSCEQAVAKSDSGAGSSSPAPASLPSSKTETETEPAAATAPSAAEQIIDPPALDEPAPVNKP